MFFEVLGGGSLPLSGYFALRAQYAATPSAPREALDLLTIFPDGTLVVVEPECSRNRPDVRHHFADRPRDRRHLTHMRQRSRQRSLDALAPGCRKLRQFQRARDAQGL